MPAPRPQVVPVDRCHDFSAGNAGQQRGSRTCANAGFAQESRITKQRQVALVGIQGMGARMRADDRFASQPGLPERGLGRLFQREIGQPVVNEVDRLVAMPQAAVPAHELVRTADRSLDAVAPEQFAVQEKLGVQVLLLRPFVDDGDKGRCAEAALNRRGSVCALQPPFGEEHLIQRLLHRVGFHRLHRQPGDLGTTRPVGPCQHRVQQRAAGVGVDLDQLRAGRAQMEVESQQAAGRTRIELRAFRRPGQNRFAVMRGRDGRFRCGDHPCHGLQMLARYEHRHRREQVRVRLHHGGGQAQRAKVGLQPLPQFGLIEADAKTAAVQSLDRRGGLAIAGAGRDSG